MSYPTSTPVPHVTQSTATAKNCNHSLSPRVPPVSTNFTIFTHQFTMHLSVALRPPNNSYLPMSSNKISTNSIKPFQPLHPHQPCRAHPFPTSPSQTCPSHHKPLPPPSPREPAARHHKRPCSAYNPSHRSSSIARSTFAFMRTPHVQTHTLHHLQHNPPFCITNAMHMHIPHLVHFLHNFFTHTSRSYNIHRLLTSTPSPLCQTACHLLPATQQVTRCPPLNQCITSSKI